MKKAIIATTFVAAAAVLARRYGPALKRRAMARCDEMMARHAQHRTAPAMETANGGGVTACVPANGRGACCPSETEPAATSTAS